MGKRKSVQQYRASLAAVFVLCAGCTSNNDNAFSARLTLSASPASAADLPRTALIAQAEGDIWTLAVREGFPMQARDFNPFPATLITAADEVHYPAEYRHTLPNGLSYCRTSGVLLSTEMPITQRPTAFVLIGSTPSELNAWAQLLDADKEMTALFLAFHETGHAFAKAHPRVMRQAENGLSASQKTLLREQYGDAAGLMALTLYYPRQAVIQFARSLQAFRRDRSDNDPWHNTGQATTAVIEALTAPDWNSPPTLQDAYRTAMTIEAVFVMPGPVPALQRTSGLSCAKAPKSIYLAQSPRPQR